MDAGAPQPRGGMAPASSSHSSPFVQVCDRCRWKKIKCDGARPCSNCRNANFPCETRARLSKQATPRSYVQYLEARVRQLEGQRETEWSPQASTTRHSPYGESNVKTSSSSSDRPKKQNLPDWTVLRELGTHVIDEDGFSRYMGPSSGVGFSAKVLQEVLDDDQPPDPDYYLLFSLDDFSRARLLEASDNLIWEVIPSNLPRRDAVDLVLKDFFTYTERVFPVLHRPTFMKVVDDLYSLDVIDLEWFEVLAQFYFALSIGHCFNPRMNIEEKTRNQIRGLQTGIRSYMSCLHKRRDNLVRLQTFTLHSYALVLLRQRSEAMRISAMANTKALECGLHHDGRQFAGNPLETEMRRRVFWCVFMLHLFNSSLEGLPRALHEADITIAEPSDIDDDQLTTTEIRNALPGRTKIHRFVSVCRLVRILSRVLDVLYSHNKRKQASTRIEQMESLPAEATDDSPILTSIQNRLCCEHLLDQLDFSFEETPDDIPDPDSNDTTDMAILASYANEQILYHYIRWLIHRPGMALPQSDPQFASCLQISTEAAACLIRLSDVYKKTVHLIKINPGLHPFTVFVAALTPIYRTTLMKAMPGTIPMFGFSADADLESCQHGLIVLEYFSRDHADVVRRRVLQKLVKKVFGDDHEELHRLSTIPSNDPALQSAVGAKPDTQSSSKQDIDMAQHPIEFQEQRIEHMMAHEDLRNFVHDAFSPGTELWAPGADFSIPRPPGT